MGCNESKTKEQKEEKKDDEFSNVNQKTEEKKERVDSQVREDPPKDVAPEAPVVASPPDEETDDDEDETFAPAPVDSRYKGPGPKVGGEAIECFKGGLLYRMVDKSAGAKHQFWGFYNDTSDLEMHVTFKFMKTRDGFETLGNTTSEDIGEMIAVSCVIYPGETEEFVSGHINGYRSSMSAKPLSEEYQDRVTKQADALVSADLAAFRKARGSKSAGTEADLKRCIEAGVKYVDESFVPSQNSLSRSFDDRQLHPTAWMRPTDFLPENIRDRIRIYRKIEPNDIDQGQLGDCWFLCSVASLAEFPSKIKDIFSHPVSEDHAKKERAIGAYRVTLNKHGWWYVVVLDDYLPVVGNKPCFAKNVEDPAELWVSLLEKAYAKVHGSYSTITGGDALHALQDLTGYPINRFDDEWEAAIADEAGSQELWTDLVRYDNENYLINLNTPGNDNSSYMGLRQSGNARDFEERYERAGLGMGHAYSVLQVKEFPDRNLKLLQIRNPWGNGTEWTGAWGDDSDLWNKNPDIAAAVKFEKAEDGTFWMPWEEVKRYFDGGGVCFTKFNWYDYRAAGQFANGLPNLALEIYVDQPTKMFAIMSQKDKRGLPDNDPDAEYAACMLSITRHSDNGKQQVHMNSTSDADKPSPDYMFSFSRDLAMEYTFLPEHCPYYVIPRIYESNDTKNYVLGVISEHRVGNGVSINFKTVDERCRVFQNYPKFMLEAADLHTQYQFNPEKGCPITKEGCAFSN